MRNQIVFDSESKTEPKKHKLCIFKNNKPPFNNKNLYSNSKAGTSFCYTSSQFFQLQ